MIPYLLLLVFVTLTAYLGRRSRHVAIRRLSLLVAGIAMVLFAGFRDSRIGTETGTYIRHFYASESFDIISERQDFGYYVLSWLARSWSDSYAALLVLIAMIVVSCYVTTITRVVKRYETALYLFVTLGIYTFFFNAARQGIAAAICFLAVPFLLERRLWPYVALVAVAVTFHRSALIALPLYWIASPRVRWQRLIILGGATSLTVAFFGIMVELATDLLSDKFATYAEAGEGGGKVWVTYLVGQGALLYWFKSIMPNPDGRFARFLDIYLVGLVPTVAFTPSSINPSSFLRLNMYFSPVAILLWPIVFQQFGTTVMRGVLSTGFIAMTLAFLYLQHRPSATLRRIASTRAFSHDKQEVAAGHHRHPILQCREVSS